MPLAPPFVPAIVKPLRQHGFSLHDALIALAVASILTAVALPSFKTLAGGQRMTTALNGLVTALHAARSEAIRRGERATLCPSPDGQGCTGNTEWQHGYLLFVDLNANHDHDAEEPVVRVFEPVRGIRIQTSRFRDHVTYQPNGFASGTNATFTFCAEDGATPRRQVVVSNSGRPRVTPASDDAAGC
jgi:type IV fimbrial biogenesis protein FimT